MNRKQKIVLLVGIAVIVVMGIYPPWIYLLESSLLTTRRNAGYAFIANPPKYTSKADVVIGANIDISRLYIQWFVAIVATGGLIVTFKDKKEKKGEKL